MRTQPADFEQFSAAETESRVEAAIRGAFTLPRMPEPHAAARKAAKLAQQQIASRRGRPRKKVAGAD